MTLEPSTARDRARSAAFAVLVLGGAMLGIGALLTWGSVAFREDVDPTGSATASVPGVDLWEGLLVLVVSVLVLSGALAHRSVRGDGARRLIAISIVAIGLLAAAVSASVALRTEGRLVDLEGLDAYARGLSEQLGLPFEQVRAQLEESFGEDLVVETAPGVWIATAGGLVAAVGGVLALRNERPSPVGEPAIGGDPTSGASP